jgi:hypothetical protein
MSGWGNDTGWGDSGVHGAQVEVYTADYRVAGAMQTRFQRAAEIMNLVASPHIILDKAIVTAYGEADAAFEADQLAVSFDAILLAVVAGTEAAPPSAEGMVIPKRRVQAEIVIPPFTVSGTIHITQGSRPIDTLLNASEQFLAVTGATISSTAFPAMNRQAAMVAVNRHGAQLLVVGDDEDQDQLLADVLSEEKARDWLGTADASGEP